MMWQNEFYLYCNVEAGWGGQAAGPSQAAKFLPGWCPVSCCRPCFAPSVSKSVFTITEKAPTRAFSWLKAPTSAFTFKTLC